MQARALGLWYVNEYWRWLVEGGKGWAKKQDIAGICCGVKRTTRLSNSE